MIKKIKGMKHHYISDDGKVFSDVKGEIKQLKTYYDSRGKYEMITLSQDGIRYKFLIHRLVAEHFIDNPDNLGYVNHKDYNTKNNNVDNLEWISLLENNRHMFKRSSPTRNFKKCVLFKNGVKIKEFEDTLKACEYARDNFGVSLSSLRKYRKTKDVELVII